MTKTSHFCLTESFLIMKYLYTLFTLLALSFGFSQETLEDFEGASAELLVFGGATASFSMLGDMNIAEPKALIGFAGPRVVKETIGKDLPKGFQTSESLLNNGFIDLIVHRKNMKKKLAQIIRMLNS